MEPKQDLGISFFVPCLNEEENIAQTLHNIAKAMENLDVSYEILVVDDGSTDETVPRVLEIRERRSDLRIELFCNPYCRGLGRNYFLASHRARGKHYMLVNGDAAEPPETIRAIVSHMGKADAVIPYLGLDDTRTPARRFLSVSFTFLVNLLSGHKLKYFNGPVLHLTENVRLWFAETAGFGYQAELLCRLLDEGISVMEMQVANSERERGASKALRLKNLLSVANTLLHILLRRMEKWVFRVLTNSRHGGRRTEPRLHDPRAGVSRANASSGENPRGERD